MTVPLSGLNSVKDRTLFTRRGPIVKKPLAFLTGSNLMITGPNQISISTGAFNSQFIGGTVTIVGSPNKRNDGTFYIKSVLNSTTLVLENASFDWADHVATVAELSLLANDLKSKFNAHILASGSSPYVHGTPDNVNIVNTQIAVDLDSAIILLNQIRINFLSHIISIGPPPTIHLVADTLDTLDQPAATNLESAILLANELQKKYEAHRDNAVFHQLRDSVNRIKVPFVTTITGSGAYVGPFAWTISDPRTGEIADAPNDVSVTVNGSAASVDAVFGLLGAVVLTTKPGPSDTVSIDYSFLNNPPIQIERLNSPEFGLNQAGNTGVAGWPGHTYRSRASLIDPKNPQLVRAPWTPLQTGWKYKALERASTACLNDPNTLLLNVPTNRLFFPVLNETVFEETIRYDPVTTPDTATDPWTAEGVGQISLLPGGAGLIIIDNDSSTGPGSQPPFYTHAIDLGFPSTVSAAFRCSISAVAPDGAFTGVAFGIADGSKIALAGFLETNATNLSSAIVLANSIKSNFNVHLTQVGVHRPNDVIDAIEIVDATDQISLIILINQIKALFNHHLTLGPSDVHQNVDSTDTIVLPDATDLTTAIELVNQLQVSYNNHLSLLNVHYVNDTTNVVGSVKQIGFLTNRGFPEFQENWNSAAVNWSIDITYRVFRDSTGDVSLYLSGGVTPIASALVTELPDASDLDIRIDPMQQILFGAVGRQSTSTVKWAFIRANIQPLDSDQVGDNKSVNYTVSTVPELDPIAPWVTIGQGGFERAASSKLTLDSTSSAPPSAVAELGLTTGAYRGFLRLEPIISNQSVVTVEFTTNISFYTFSLDNKAAGFFIDDNLFSTYFVFLQSTPSPAVVTGTSATPFPIAGGDTAVLSLQNQQPITITFPGPATTVAQVATVFNSAVGFPLVTDDGFGHVVLTSNISGANSKITLFGGLAFQKLGLALGTYFGKDSNPEPKVSWFGENVPDQDTPQWTALGTQPVELLGRTLRITDSSTSDFRVYNIANPLVVTPALNSSKDWKCDFRLRVDSFIAGSPVLSGTNLKFAGALVNIDEGPGGKNLELQLAVDNFGGTYLNILSFNPISQFLDQQAAFPFNWADGQVHTFDIYTNKNANLCMVLADNIVLGTFPYGVLHGTISGPSITFGSGGTPVLNGDLESARSVVDWESVCLFRDLKVADPSAAARRYVGIYAGGNPSLLSSYYISQVDWTVPHTYRIVRDPVTNVSVFIDGGEVPIISVNYDVLTLPPVSSSFLKVITNSRQCVAFGSFEPIEISRSIWGPIKYSIGKMTLTNRLIPSHQVLNQGNAIVSPEHLTSNVPHTHAGFSVYSGGTPIDEFMQDPNVVAFTTLGEGTAPVPMTQDLNSRGGLFKTATLQESVSPLTFVNTSGYLTDLENDLTNATPFSTPITELINIIIQQVLPVYNEHLVNPGVHSINDPTDQVPMPGSFTLSSAIATMNSISTSYELHRVKLPVHVIADTQYNITAPVATDAASLVTLLQNFDTQFHGHVERVDPHLAFDIIDLELLPDCVDLPTLITITLDMQGLYNAHLSQGGIHVNNDNINTSLAPPAFDLASSITVLIDLQAQFNNHIIFVNHPGSPGPHKGIDRFNSFSMAIPVDLPTAIAFANSFKIHFNNHILVQDSHLILDAQGDALNPNLPNLLVESIVVLNNLKAAFNKHIVQYRVHVANDMQNAILLPNAFDAASAIVLANTIKAKYNAHRVSITNDSGTHSHTMDDTVNVVSTPNAIDVSTMAVLADALNSAYNLHRTQAGVHASSIFIRLDPPNRVVYESMEFFKVSTGIPGHMSPFSDDETWHIDTIYYQKDHQLSYQGDYPPEQVTFQGTNRQPFSLANNDIMFVSVDNGPQIKVVFQSTDTTLANVIARINGTPGIPPGFAWDDFDDKVHLVSPTIGPSSAIAVSGVAAVKLGLDTAQFTPWIIASDVPSNVSVVVNPGPPDFLRYQTTGTGTKTVYKSASGLPDVTSLDFEVLFSVRINATSPDSSGDTNIYFGISGIAGPGFSAAIGFEVISGINYVKLQDLKANKCLFRKAFNWADGAFHNYKIIRSVLTDSFSLEVDS